ncbi:MAG: hypothetical protein HQ581_23565, partial [Planctomycetes bacterium]|nr:hypothetical protein [Planctomycetota bacterium]
PPRRPLPEPPAPETTPPAPAPPERLPPRRPLPEPPAPERARTGTIWGSVLADNNGDGIRDAKEPGLAGCTIRLQRLGPDSGPIRTFVSPKPGEENSFGLSISASGDRVLIGAPRADLGANNTGAAYLFDCQTGELLHALNTSASLSDACLGLAVAIAGDRAAVATRRDTVEGVNSGSVYLFDVPSGKLRHVIRNPSPDPLGKFGRCLSFHGDQILIGSPRDDAAGKRAGAMYLFDFQTAELVHVFSNPQPDRQDYFGNSVAVADGRFLIGKTLDSSLSTDTLLAYLFDAKTKSQLHAVHRPLPKTEERLGNAIAVSDRNAVAISHRHMLIGVPPRRWIENGEVAAYANDPTTGEFRFTLSNPSRIVGRRRNCESLAILDDLLLVGCPDQGKVCLFDGVTGDLLQTLTAPRNVRNGKFGFTVAVLDGQYAFVGAIGDDLAAANAGAVYMYELPVRTTVTDADGNYAFEDLPPGKYRVCVESTGDGSRPLMPTSVQVITVEPGQSLEPVDLAALTSEVAPPVPEVATTPEVALPVPEAPPRPDPELPPPAKPIPIHTATGSVYDNQNGNGRRDRGEPPLAGCTVRWQRLGSESGPIEAFTGPRPVLGDHFGIRTSDFHGSYSLEGLPPGEYRVCVEAAGEGPQSVIPGSVRIITLRSGRQYDRIDLVGPASTDLRPALKDPLYRDAVLLLTFDEETLGNRTGTVRIADLSRRDNSGFAVGATPTKEGKVGGAYSLDGKDDIIALPILHEDLRRDVTGFSFIAWIRGNRYESSESFIFDCGNYPSQGLSVFRVAGDKDEFLGFSLAERSGGKKVVAPIAKPDQWQHIASIWDGEEQRLYVDGQLLATESTDPLVLNGKSIGYNRAQLGAYATSRSRKPGYFKGLIDEVAIFTRAISEEEIRTLHRMGNDGVPLGNSPEPGAKSPLPPGED